MFAKWSLRRNPFYTRAVDRSSLADFIRRAEVHRQIPDKELPEGLHLVIGERGVGTTSLANYLRFTKAKAFSPTYEIRIEGMRSTKDLLESIIFCLAKEIVEKKIRSSKAKEIIRSFEGHSEKPSFQVQAAGFGIGWNHHPAGAPEDNLMALTSIYDSLVSDVLRTRAITSVSIQINNFEIPHIFSEDQMREILEPLRDIFQGRGVTWLVIGDTGFEDLISLKMDRFSSIIRNQVRVDPIDTDSFVRLVRQRIRNSGPKAQCPFSEEGLRALARSCLGRTRFALDLAAELTEKYADQPLPEFIDGKCVESEAKSKINRIAASNHFPEVSTRLLHIICANPGINSSSLAAAGNIQPGNVRKYVNPLERARLIRILRKGRSTLYQPYGLGLILSRR